MEKIRHSFSSLGQKTLLCVGIVLCVATLLFLRGDSDDVSLRVVSISENTQEYSIEAEYPQFLHVPKFFNKKIENRVLDQIASFKKDITDMPREARRKDDQYLFRSSWDPDQLTGKVISMILRQYVYVGGAHGIHSIETFSFDFSKKKEITLEDVFSGTAGYLERVSHYTMNDIKTKLGSEAVMDMIRAGTAPDPKNFSVFTVSRDNMVTFYFAEYQVAPYASGEQTVTMPISFITGAK